ncbi:MAG: PPOX class F420-dependent oxidoreductase [Herpetosiphonaceae bacterium]|nr:PPOX class F420-dependent oxidoreductase [Herpetosiphonaceae bacterium]
MPKADKLSPGGVKLLQEKQIAQFATVMADNSPQITPVWVDVEPDGSHILINTDDSRLKTKNTTQNPEVAVSVVDSQNSYRYAVVRGTVVERRHEGASEHIDHLAQKYLGQERYPMHTPDESRVILRIKPHHVMEQGV